MAFSFSAFGLVISALQRVASPTLVVVLLFPGIWHFRRMEKTFADVI
jgi:hypothetical protein